MYQDLKAILAYDGWHTFDYTKKLHTNCMPDNFNVYVKHIDPLTCNDGDGTAALKQYLTMPVDTSITKVKCAANTTLTPVSDLVASS